MEFFRIVKVKTQDKNIQEELTNDKLESISNNIFIIGEQNENEAQIGGIWGEFTLIRSKIRGGLRFALAECPNALAWTITTGFDPAPKNIVIHLTINRLEIKESFIEEIDEFLDDHSTCLEEYFNQNISNLEVL